MSKKKKKKTKSQKATSSKKNKKKRRAPMGQSSSGSAQGGQEASSGLMGNMRGGLQSAASGNSRWLNILLWILVAVAAGLVIHKYFLQ